MKRKLLPFSQDPLERGQLLQSCIRQTRHKQGGNAMNNNTNARNKTLNTREILPLRCSVCGKPFLNVYANTLPGMIFATCRSGHKTSYRVNEGTRKAV